MHTFLGKARDVGKDPCYFAQRFCFIDYRGYIEVDPTAEFGFNISIYTASHPADWLLKDFTTQLYRTSVVIRARVWICSNVTLYNCMIGEGAVVGLGSVVRSKDVAPFTMVAGNPVQVIAKFEEGRWIDI